MKKNIITLLEGLWNEIAYFFGDSKKEDFSSSQKATGARYIGHPEAVIVSCYFNPTKSPARRRAFDRFYQSVRHMNHRVVECVIGKDGVAELPENENISRVYTRDVLWHKEALINHAAAALPERFRYVFWIDADVLFTNYSWLPEAVARLASDAVIVQPFEFAVHLEENEGEQPSFDANRFKSILCDAGALRRGGQQKHRRVLRGFAANWETCRALAGSTIYDEHGHVGFAWGARRELLEAVPLYDRALVGGADHIIAHAAAGQIPSECIDKSFTAVLEEVYEWSSRFANATRGRLAFVSGDVYHLWHGDLKKRDYLNRIREFTPLARSVRRKDNSGLYTSDDERVTGFVENYLYNREVKPHDDSIDESRSSAGSPPFSQNEAAWSGDAGASWSGFGGGGDFDGGGAGGEWSSNDSFGAFPVGGQPERETTANISPPDDSAATFAAASEYYLTSESNENFS